MYRHRTAQYQFVRVDQGKQLQWILDNAGQAIHCPDALFAAAHEVPSDCPL